MKLFATRDDLRRYRQLWREAEGEADRAALRGDTRAARRLTADARRYQREATAIAARINDLEQ